MANSADLAIFSPVFSLKNDFEKVENNKTKGSIYHPTERIA